MHKSHILERHVTNIMAKIHKRPSACSLDCYCYRILWKTNSSIAKPNQLLYEQNVSSVFSTKAITRTSSISQWTCYFLPFVPSVSKFPIPWENRTWCISPIYHCIFSVCPSRVETCSSSRWNWISIASVVGGSAASSGCLISVSACAVGTPILRVCAMTIFHLSACHSQVLQPIHACYEHNSWCQLHLAMTTPNKLTSWLAGTSRLLPQGASCFLPMLNIFFLFQQELTTSFCFLQYFHLLFLPSFLLQVAHIRPWCLIKNSAKYAYWVNYVMS